MKTKKARKLVKVALLFVLSLIIINGIIWVPNFDNEPFSESTNSPNSSKSTSLHDISISSNWDYVSQQPWCNGSGTPDDPYKIFGVTFKSNSTEYCLKIENSNAHAIIMGCTFRDAKKGIHLINCKNLFIKNNQFEAGFSYGINVENSQEVKVINNDIQESSVSGIHVIDSSLINLTENVALRCKYGFYIKHSTSSNVSRNIGNFSTASGIQLYDCTSVKLEQNEFCNNTRDGILLWESKKNVLNKNTLCGNSEYGIRIFSSNNNTVHNNTLLYNGAANVTQMKGSSNNLFSDNYWGQVKKSNEEQEAGLDLQFAILLGFITMIIGAISLGVVISYRPFAKNHVFTIEGSEKNLKCPKCGERKKAFIQKGVDEKTILYRYPTVVYGNYYACKRCGTRWRFKQS